MSGASCLRLTLGPLHYEFRAHDPWGNDALSRLRNHLHCVAFTATPDRVIHSLAFRLTPQEHAQINSDYLPDRLASLLPEDPPRGGWSLTGDETGHMSWCHVGTPHTIWSYNTIPAECQAPFQLPWQPVFEDIVKRGGGILHGGLVVLEQRGYVVTAPPGGGKTTALARLPARWQVLSDDAVLVWPGDDAAFQASPLPTWSVLLGRKTSFPTVRRWQVGTRTALAGVILLKPSRQERLDVLQPVEACPHLYRALSEHPRVVTNRDPFRESLFRAACALAKALPTWELELTRAGEFWTALPVAFVDA